jgi:hypothetical protein
MRSRGTFHPPISNHTVQFYEDPAELIRALTLFTKEGLARNESVILIATGEHGTSLKRRLGTKADRDRLVLFDARAVIDRLLRNGRPDPRRFDGLVRDILASTGGRPMRGFGEGVDLLARDGNFEAAILLEEMWNALLRRQSFPLYCAYDVTVFYKAMRGSEYRHLRCLHGQVIAN